jgi:hypothetical protein
MTAFAPNDALQSACCCRKANLRARTAAHAVLVRRCCSDRIFNDALANVLTHDVAAPGMRADKGPPNPSTIVISQLLEQSFNRVEGCGIHTVENHSCVSPCVCVAARTLMLLPAGYWAVRILAAAGQHPFGKTSQIETADHVTEPSRTCTRISTG